MTTTTIVYRIGLIITIASVAFVALDQLVLTNLDSHLHQVYDPHGKSLQAGVVYAYLYGLGVIGVACWLWTLRRAKAGQGAIASVVIALLAAFPILGNVLVQEYGSVIITLQLGIGFVIAWVCGVIGAAALVKSTVSAAASAR